MTKEKKTLEGKIDGVSEVTETKKEGLFWFGVKANNDWYGFSGTLKDCQAEHEPAQEAKDKGHVVAFTYTEDGNWLNITKVGSWKVEGGKDEHEHRLRRVRHMIVCLEDAEEAWTEWFFGMVVAKEDLTPEDLTNIREIANGFMTEDGRKGRG